MAERKKRHPIRTAVALTALFDTGMGYVASQTQEGLPRGEVIAAAVLGSLLFLVGGVTVAVVGGTVRTTENVSKGTAHMAKIGGESLWRILTGKTRRRGQGPTHVEL